MAAADIEELMGRAVAVLGNPSADLPTIEQALSDCTAMRLSLQAELVRAARSTAWAPDSSVVPAAGAPGSLDPLPAGDAGPPGRVEELLDCYERADGLIAALRRRREELPPG